MSFLWGHWYLQAGWQECGSHPTRMLSCCSKIVAVPSVVHVYLGSREFFVGESQPIKPSASICCRCFRPPVQMTMSNKVHRVQVSWGLKLSDGYKTKIVPIVSLQEDVRWEQIALISVFLSITKTEFQLDWWHFTLESIPVGCVPPARYHTGVSLTTLTETTGQRPPWTDLPPLPKQRPPEQRSPGQGPPSRQIPPWTETPQWTESQTGVKTLPCRNFVMGGENGPLQILQMVFKTASNVLRRIWPSATCRLRTKRTLWQRFSFKSIESSSLCDRQSSRALGNLWKVLFSERLHTKRMGRNRFSRVFSQLLASTAADPGFPRGGGANSSGGRQHTILPNFPKNCMKLKEFGPRGGRASLAPPLDPPLFYLIRWIWSKIILDKL